MYIRKYFRTVLRVKKKKANLLLVYCESTLLLMIVSPSATCISINLFPITRMGVIIQQWRTKYKDHTSKKKNPDSDQTVMILLVFGTAACAPLAALD